MVALQDYVGVVLVARFLALVALTVASDASEHVSGGSSDSSSNVLCELCELRDAELADNVVHVVELVTGYVSVVAGAVLYCGSWCVAGSELWSIEARAKRLRLGKHTLLHAMTRQGTRCRSDLHGNLLCACQC